MCLYGICTWVRSSSLLIQIHTIAACNELAHSFTSWSHPVNQFFWQGLEMRLICTELTLRQGKILQSGNFASSCGYEFTTTYLPGNNYQYFFIFPTSIMLLALMVRMATNQLLLLWLVGRGPLPIIEVSIDTKHLLVCSLLLFTCRIFQLFAAVIFCVLCMQDGSGWGGNSSCTWKWSYGVKDSQWTTSASTASGI